MKKTLPLLAIALALSVNAYALQIADAQYQSNTKYNNVRLSDYQDDFNTINAKESGGVDVGMVVVWNRAENPLNWEKWMECNGASMPEEQAKLLNSDMCKDYHICTVPDFTGRFLRQQGGNGGVVGTQQDDEIKRHKHGITLSMEMSGSHDEHGFPQVDWSGPMVYHGPEQPDGSWQYRNGGGNPLHSFGGVENRPLSHTVRYLIRVNE